MATDVGTPENAAADRLASARTLVVKVGSALLVDGETGAVNVVWMAGLAADLARLRGEGRGVLIVSSGAVALGRRRLGLAAGRLDLNQKQAAAAAGQTALMRAWEEALAPVGIAAAQVLLTRDDTEVRRRWLNARATLRTLLALEAMPVVNENDTVATEELRWGDNDRLAARAAQMVGAQLLVLLSDVDGLYTADPRRDPAARHLPRVGALTGQVLAMAGGANAASGVGTGGMATKLEAARIAADAGCATVVALGRTTGGEGPLAAIAAGARATLIEPATTPLAAYKQWIAGGPAPAGALQVDPGAAAALRGGASLLPAGVRAVRGVFDKGDAVAVVDAAGRELARGLAAYDADAARRIAGLHSRDIEAALGYAGGPVLIHRDDLVLRP